LWASWGEGEGWEAVEDSLGDGDRPYELWADFVDGFEEEEGEAGLAGSRAESESESESTERARP
jgi:hypothetical protein